MRRYPLALLATLLLCLVGDHALLAQNAADRCPPAYSKLNKEATRRAIETKKAEMRRRGFPERFLQLLDKEECPKCVEIASDSFHIMVVYNDDDNAPTDTKGRRWKTHTFGWDPQSERQVRDELAAGKIKAFYIMNTATRCDCCPEVEVYHTPEDYSDWNEELEVNMSHVIEFDDPGDLGPLPQDLENPPGGWIDDVPDISRTAKPPKRFVHAICDACQGLADRWNNAADTLDYLWDRKRALLYGVSITENAIAKRANDIARLEYQQLFSTRTDARQQQIDMLKGVNDAQRQGIDYDMRRVENIEQSIKEQDARMAALMKELIDCENRCKTRVATPPPVAETPSAPVTPVTPVTPAPVPGPVAVCSKCQRAADAVRDARAALERREARLAAIQEKYAAISAVGPSGMANDNLPQALLDLNREGLEAEQEILRAEAALEDAEYQLKRCEDSCSTTVDSPAAPKESACFGDSCSSTWSSCESSGTCKPADRDCGIPGACDATPSGAPPLINMIDSGPWETAANADIDSRVQDKLVDIIDPDAYPQFAQPFPGMTMPAPGARNVSGSEPIDYEHQDTTYVVFDPVADRRGVRQWFNPLGLLARNLIEHVERWRGSLGPKPLVTARDLDTIDRVSGAQAAGLPKGFHVLLSDQGGSTGRTLVMQVLNLSGQRVRLSSRSFAVQPIKQQAQQEVLRAFSRLSTAAPARLNLSAYCVEFLKAPPGPSTLLRLAPANLQQKYASMSKVLQSAYRVTKAKGLRPDSNPAAYTDSIKQWALWTVEQKLTESKYTEAFIGHTKKNVEAAGQQWSKAAEDTVRKVSPNRWRDIVRILQGAGVPVPR